MKLISLYIENFGRLHQYTLNFEEGLTSIVQPNGFGKTTLAEFIRAMFYGFPRKSKALDKSYRQKYTPWQGGTFGGNLTFEYRGQCYRVERTFGANPKGDTFALIDLDTNRKTNRFTEELGLELFGLDADSFERSTYLPQLWDGGSLATASIQAKLSDLVEDRSDVAGFDKAMAELKTRRSALIPYRGSGGAVAEKLTEITGLQLQLDALNSQEKLLAVSQEEMVRMKKDAERIEAALLQLGEQLQTASQQEKHILRQQQYLQLQNRYNKASERLRFYQKQYPCGLPREDALHRAELAAERLKQCANMTAGDEVLPTAAQLDGCRSLCRTYEALQVGLRDAQLRMAEVKQEEYKPSVKVPVGTMLFAAAGIASGAVMVFLLELVYGFVFLGAGALAMAAAAATLCIRSGKIRRQRRETEETQTELQRKLDIAGARAEKTRREITAFFVEFGLNVEPRQYTAALEELEQRIAGSRQQKHEFLTISGQLKQFFEGMGRSPVQDYSAELQKLREDMREIQTAQTLMQELSEQLAIMEEECGGILHADFSAARDPQQLRCTEQQLRKELTGATTRLLQLQQKIQQLQTETAQIPDLKANLEQARQCMEADREKAELLDATMAFLQQARENLATSYMGTIRSRFGEYLSMLGSGDEQYLVDTDLQIKLVRQGQARALAHFSAGQTDLVMLCMRLSLADALFGGQEMFMILDDPFVNLDDSHTEQARLLLKKLAVGRQIIYLTCHSGRMV